MKIFQKRALVVFTIVLFLFLLSALLVDTYNSTIRNKLKDSANQELMSVAKLKSSEVSKWYSDEIGDAAIISNNSVLNERVGNWMDMHSDNNLLKIQKVFKELILEHGYSEIFLLSNYGDLIVSGTGSKPEVNERQIVLQSVQQKEVCSTDLFKSEADKKIYIDFASPVFDGEGKPLYVVLFKIDPDGYLFPFIQSWPLPSSTAETLILRSDVDSVVFLNELRHVKGAALSLKIPISRYDVPAIYAVQGNEGVFEGLDYRGEKVISYVTHISGTPWYMVAKVDQNELYTGMNQQRISFFVILALIILLILLVIGFIYTSVQRNTFKRLWLSQEEFKTTLYSIGDAVITTDNKGIVKNLNPVAEVLTGWLENDAINKPIEEIFHIVNEETHEKIENPVNKVIVEGGIVGLDNHTILISKEGKEIPIADSGAPIHDRNGEISGVVLVFRNQAGERDYQKKIEEQRRQVYTLLSNLPGMAYRCNNDRDWTMEFVSKGCFELTGYFDSEVVNNREVTYGSLIVPDDQDFVWQIVQDALADRQSFELEYRIFTKSGQIKWVWEKGIGIYDKDGICVAIEGLINDIDQHKLAETALKKSEEQFESLARNTSVGIFRTDAVGNIIYANPKWHELTGLSFDQIHNSDWLYAIHPDDRLAVKEKWDQAVKLLTNSPIEYRFLHPNGRIVWVKTQVAIEKGDKDEFLGLFGAITDITDKVKTQESLKNANELLNTIIDNIPDSIYMKDLDGRKVIVNMANVINSGLNSKDDLIGKNDFDIFPEEIAREFWKDDQEVMRNGFKIINKVEKVMDKWNHIHWFRTSKIPFVDESGKIIGLVGIGHDITKQKFDDDERMRLLTAVNQSPVSIVITDYKGIIQYVNPHFVEVTGYATTQVLGKKPNILKSGMHSVELYQQMWATISSGHEWKGELQNKKRNGELFWENVLIAPVRNDTGAIANYVAIKEDITDKKKLMTELIKAKERAEESDRLKTSFLANMSHEIRTPLNSILGFTNILNDGENLSSFEREEYSGIINKSADSLLQIINDIIDISSLETGQLNIVVSSFDVKKVIGTIFKEFSKKISKSEKPKLQLRQLLVENDLIIESDINRLNQIFINLLTNAFKFTEKGFIEFGIEKCDINKVYFKVEDTGIGIREEMQAVIFERFRRGDDNTVRLYGGNGLGLSIVKNLIDLMGGEIWVTSEVGKGSVFRFYLPIKTKQV